MPFKSSLLGAGTFVLLLFATPAGAQDQPRAITRVTVVDMKEGSLQPEQTVVVEGSRIVRVGPAGEVTVPENAVVIDGTGRYLIPGLWDMHTHSWDEALLRDIFVPLYVAHGVTGIREMSGRPFDLELRAEVAAGTLLGPRMVIGTPNVDGPNPWPGEDIGADVVRVGDPHEAREMVDSLKAEGYDFIQTSQFVSPAAYRALHERGREVGMEISGRVPLSVSLWEAAALGHRTVEHLWGVELACSSREEELRVDYRQRVREISADTAMNHHIRFWNQTEWEPLESVDPQKCRALYRHLAAQGTWVVPTLLMQHLLSHTTDPAYQDYPERYLPAQIWNPEGDAEWLDPERRLRPVYEHRLRTLVDLHQAGVGVLAGGEAPAGFTLHDELALYVESGLSPLEALRTATVNPARYLEATDSLGTVETGKLADLVLLEANPIEDIRNTRRIAAVFLNGRYIDREALDALLAGVEKAASAWQN